MGPELIVVLPWDEFAKFLIALIVIVDPLAAIPIYLAAVGKLSSAEHNRNAKIAALTVLTALVVTIFAGDKILGLFGIGLPAFRVGGGIVILLMAVSMLRGRPGRIRHTEEEADEAAEKDAIAVVPIGIPLLAGPGAISTAIIAAHDFPGSISKLILCGAVLLVAPMVWISLRFAVPIGKYLGKTGINIANRLMGLILAAIAVEFITEGLRQLFPALG